MKKYFWKRRNDGTSGTDAKVAAMDITEGNEESACSSSVDILEARISKGKPVLTDKSSVINAGTVNINFTHKTFNYFHSAQIGVKNVHVHDGAIIKTQTALENVKIRPSTNSPYSSLLVTWESKEFCQLSAFTDEKMQRLLFEETVEAEINNLVLTDLKPDTRYYIKLETMRSHQIVPITCKTVKPIKELQYKYITSSLGEEIGRGANTVVYKKDKDGEEIAVKQISTDDIKQELSVLSSLNTHDNVIQYKWSEQDDEYVYLCFEFCQNNLKHFIEQKKTIPHGKIETMRQIALGLQFLHTPDRKKNATIHRDLKPSNIFLSFNDKWKIGDFSISKNISTENVDEYTRTKYESGTMNYMPYESLYHIGKNEERTQSPKTDIFSLGILFFYILTEGENPFHVAQQPEPAYARIIYREKPSFHNLRQEDNCFKTLLRKMLFHDQELRPSIHEVLAHPIFWDAKKKINFLVDIADHWDATLKVKIENSRTQCMLNTHGRNCGEDCQRQCVMFEEEWTTSFEACPRMKENIDDRNGPYRVSGNKRKKVFHLVRKIRNIWEHFYDDRRIPPYYLSEARKQEMRIENDKVKRLREEIGDTPENYIAFFEEKFPLLICKLYDAISPQDHPKLREYYAKDIASY